MSSSLFPPLYILNPTIPPPYITPTPPIPNFVLLSFPPSAAAVGERNKGIHYAASGKDNKPIIMFQRNPNPDLTCHKGTKAEVKALGIQRGIWCLSPRIKIFIV